MSSRLSGLFRPLATLACVCLAAWSAGCGSDDSGGDSASQEAQAKAPYGPPSRTTVTSYRRQRADGTTLDVTSEVTGDITVQGLSYLRHRLGDFLSTQPSGSEMWLTQPDQDTVVVAGGEFWSHTILPVQPGDSTATLEFDQPITVDLAPPVGQPQTVTGAATVTLLGQPMQVDGTATYTMTSDDDTVETLAGTLHGCRKYEGNGSATSSDLAAALGATEASATAWYHPGLGAVKADITVPGKGEYAFDFLGTRDMGTATSGTNRIEAMAVLGTLERFELNTYDVHQAFDADKDQHAQMLLEVRFADAARAMTTDTPPVVVEFGTVMGVFPAELTASPVSFFHPEENGKGYTFWIGYVNQAAKNEPSNGIAYHVSAQVPDYGTSRVRVTGRIIYQLYTP